MDERPAQAEDRTVRIERHLHVPGLVALLRGGDEVLAPVLDPLQRLAEMQRRRGDGYFFGIGHQFRAEAAAQIGHRHLHLAGLTPEHLAELLLQCLGRLGRTPYREYAIEVGRHGKDAAPLHRHRRTAMNLEAAADPVGGLGKRVIHIAESEVEGCQAIVVVAAMNRRGTGLQRGAAIADRVQRFVVDIQHIGRVFGRRPAFGDDHCHRFADMDDLVDRQHGTIHLQRDRLARQADDESVVPHERRQVGMRQHGNDTRHRQRGFRVDRGEGCMGIGAARERYTQAAGWLEIVEKTTLAADERPVFQTPHGPAKYFWFPVHADASVEPERASS